MTRTVAGFSILVVVVVFVAGLAAHYFHPPVEAIPHTTPVKPTNPTVPDDRVMKKYAFHYFGAAWCEPCRRMQANTLNEPNVQKALEDKFGFNIAIYDIDNWPGLQKSLHIDLVPTYFIYEGEKIVKRGSGYLSPKDFLDWIR